MSKITKIEPVASTDYVYDPVCDAPHAYISNGLVSHNCVLLVDEIDKGFGGLGGGGDSGVSMRVLGSFLNWLQDRDIQRYPVFIVATANNVTGLPPELMRKGRVDEIFACSFPSASERAEIFKIHLSKRGHNLSDADLKKVADRADKFVGAEIEGVVQSAILEAFDKGMKAPTAELLIQHVKQVRPLAEAFPDRVQMMHEWAKNNAKPASSGMQFDGSASKETAEKKPVGKLRTIRTGPIKGSRNLDA